MNLLAERWCDLSSPLRLGAWLVLGLLPAIVVGISCRTTPSELPPVPLQAQWRKIMPLRSVGAAPPALPSTPFSALGFDGAASRLVSWQPAGKGGALILEADWLAVPSLFSLLAEQRQAVRGFSIQPEQQHLKLTFELEAIDNE